MATTQSRFKRNKLTKKLSKMSKEVTLACAIRGTATRNIAVLSQVTEQMNMAQDLLKTHKDETHGYKEMLLADRHSPSYIALGAVFPTTLKRMVTAPQGLGRLERYAQLMQGYPLVGIGGIDFDRLPSVVKTGVGSVAVVRAITESESPETTVIAFQQAIQKNSGASALS